MMEEPGRFLAGVLRAGARAFAGYAAADLLDRCSEAREGFGPDPFAAWQDFLAARIEELAAASATGRPILFASQVLWASSLLEARGVPPAQVAAGLERLRDVLERELPDGAKEPASEAMGQALSVLSAGPAGAPDRLVPDAPDRRLAMEYLAAALAGDRVRAGSLILDRVRAGGSAADLYLNVLAAAQAEVGAMWHQNEITIAEEHIATATTSMVAAQLAAFARAKDSNGRTVLATAVEGDFHDVGILIASYLFELEGWRTIFLGAGVPIRDLVEVLHRFSPDLLLLSAALSIHLPAVRATIRAVRAAGGGRAIQILVGGQAFAGAPDLWRDVGADGTGRTAVEAIQCADRLFGGKG
ncbi:MAG: cobalamin-dependent protein [Planctomycetes bacterium]|nr:cobalamin-dependent protein [Planctomycetota bacterium]